MSAEASPLLSPTQRRLAASAIGLAAVLAIGAAALLIFLGLARFLAAFSGVIWPLATAGILALILRPVVALFERRLRVRRTMAVVLLYGLFLIGVTGLVLTFVPALISQLIDLFAYLPTLWQNTLAWGEQHFPEWLTVARRYLENPAVKGVLDGLAQQAQDLLAHVAPTLKSAGAGLFNVFGLVASLAVIPVYLFFFLLTDDDPTKELPDHLGFLKPELRDDLIFLVREFLGILIAFFRGQILIGLIMGVLLAVGFSLAGLKFGLVLGLLIGLLNIVPYLGSILGLSIVLPLALFQSGGGAALMGGCLAVFSAVQLLEGWFLTPRIMGEQTGLHPVAIIVAVFFWGQALDGVLGMLLAVPLTAFFVIVWRLAKQKYFHA